MKITLNQLKRIIREAVEQEMHDEVEEAISDESFDDIILSETRMRRRLNEDFGIGTIVLAGLLGVLAWKGIGVAAKAAGRVVGHMALEKQDQLEEKARLARRAEYRAVLDMLSNDRALADMLNQLDAMRGTATANEVKAHSKAITAYVNSQIKGKPGAHHGAQHFRSVLSKRRGR